MAGPCPFWKDQTMRIQRDICDLNAAIQHLPKAFLDGPLVPECLFLFWRGMGVRIGDSGDVGTEV